MNNRITWWIFVVFALSGCVNFGGRNSEPVTVIIPCPSTPPVVRCELHEYPKPETLRDALTERERLIEDARECKQVVDVWEEVYAVCAEVD